MHRRPFESRHLVLMVELMAFIWSSLLKWNILYFYAFLVLLRNKLMSAICPSKFGLTYWIFFIWNARYIYIYVYIYIYNCSSDSCSDVVTVGSLRHCMSWDSVVKLWSVQTTFFCPVVKILPMPFAHFHSLLWSVEVPGSNVNWSKLKYSIRNLSSFVALPGQIVWHLSDVSRYLVIFKI